MLVNEKNTVVAKESPILPGLHLSNAKYTDVIERQLLDGSSDDEKVKLCVSSNIEMRKCNAMRDVAYSRDIRPSFECIMKDNDKCAEDLKTNKVDAIVVQARSIGKYNLDDLKPLLYEAFDDDDKYVVIADQDTSYNDLKKLALYETKVLIRFWRNSLIFFSFAGNSIRPTFATWMQRFSFQKNAEQRQQNVFAQTTLKTPRMVH